MCGIAGVLGLPPEIATPAASRMREAVRLRGPDGEGTETIAGPPGMPPVVLAHTRLAIIDLSCAGRQPMSLADASGRPSLWITFNGEIYNFAELRMELAKLGHVARTGTDTEVILLAYRAWGEAAVSRLRGMFAFVLADTARDRIWFVRDRLGIKPLYLFERPGGGLLFASEVRGLLAAGPDLVPPRLSRGAIESFLAQGAVFGGDSHVERVRLLAPGETLTTDFAGKVVDRRSYWSPPFARSGAATPTRIDATVRLGVTAREAVRQHLVADVPVGVFLSSGVDSTAIATLATETASGRVRTISIGFDRPEFDETAEAEAYARELGTDHRTVRITSADIRADFDRVLAAVDQPTVDGFNTYYVSRAARRDAGVTVALSGLGGDELFGGYASFVDVPRAARWLRFAPRFFRGIARGAAGMAKSRALLKIAEGIGRPHDLANLYLLRRELFLPDERRALAPLLPHSDALCGLPTSELNGLEKTVDGLDPENAISALELGAYMRHMLLRDSDVFSMAHGLELRVPLLDHELVERAAELPAAWKRPDGLPKRLLIEAVGPRLPAKVGRGKKRGFTFPWADWFRGDLRTSAGERLTERGVWVNLGFEPEVPGRLWARFLRRDPAVGGLHILALVVLADVATRQRLTLA
jgi:asparagine synthase (glutamine-hydrolysing)